MERFGSSIGVHFKPEWITSLSDEELLSEIDAFPSWDIDLLRELCYRADMLEDWETADDTNFEFIVNTAINKMQSCI